jgi:DNA-binding PadR family transcriptional regulator
MAAKRLRVPRLSEKESIVIALLLEHEQMYGLEMVSASPRHLKRGTIYVTLGRMEDKGYITSRLEDAPPHAGGLPRRIYRPTAQGRQIFAVWNRALTELAPRFAR